jgi:hypothetical protein
MSISSDFTSRHAAVAVLSMRLCACSSPDPGEPNEPTYVKIDDMEGTSGRIGWSPENAAPDALPGRWVSYADTQCEDLVPVPEWAEGGMWSYAELGEAHETMPGVTSSRAARLRTTAALVNTWGAGMGFQFSEPPSGSDPIRVTRPCTAGMLRDLEYPAAAVDLSRNKALVFWGMARKEAGSTRLLVQFQDVNTDPRGGVCNPVPGSADECYNGFGVVLELGETPSRYVLNFSELKQDPTWGYRPNPSVMDLEQVYGLVFQMDTPGGACPPPIVCIPLPELSFDVWIDDLYFVER